MTLKWTTNSQCQWNTKWHDRNEQKKKNKGRRQKQPFFCVFRVYCWVQFHTQCCFINHHVNVLTSSIFDIQSFPMSSHNVVCARQHFKGFTRKSLNFNAIMRWYVQNNQFPAKLARWQQNRHTLMRHQTWINLSPNFHGFSFKIIYQTKSVFSANPPPPRHSWSYNLNKTRNFFGNSFNQTLSRIQNV